MRFTKLRFVTFLVGLILSAQVFGQSYELIAPKSWYLEINKEISNQINNEFAIKLEEGIYFSNQRDAQIRDDITVGELLDSSVISLELNGLILDSHFGFARRNFQSNPELWLILPSQEKFMLTKETQSGWSKERISPLVDHWMPVRGGILTSDFSKKIDLDKIKEKKSVINESVKTFYISNGGEKSQLESMLLFQETREVKKQDKKFIESFSYYDRLYNRMYYVTQGKQQKLIAIDFTNDTKETIVNLSSFKADEWFSMRNEGLYYTVGSDLFYVSIDLSLMGGQKEYFQSPVKIYTALKDNTRIEETLDLRLRLVLSVRTNIKKKKAASYTVNQKGEIARYVAEANKFHPSTEIEDQTIVGIEHIELAGALKSGLKSPVYGHESVTRFLADTMASAEGTWATIRYEDGQLPKELIASFVWDMNTQSIPLHRELQAVDRVWMVDGERLFDIKDQEQIQDYLTVLHGLILSRNSLLVMNNFPTTLETESGATVETVKRFWKTFRDCINAGTCRVITTVKDNVFKKLDDSIFDILAESKQLIVPNLDKDERLTVTKQELKNLERRKGLRLSDDAFQFLISFALKFGRNKASPDNEIGLLKELFGYMNTFHPTARLVNRTLAKEWIEHKRGVDRLRRTVDIEGLRKFLKRKVVSHDAVIDAICNSLRPAVNGTHFSNKPLAFAAMTGMPGVGKTYIAKLIAEYLTGPDSALMVDMKTFNGFPQNDPIRKAIQGSKSQIRVVVFDDVDQISAQQLDLLAGVVEEGYYAQGTAQELSFSNTIVIWTANWGEKVIRGSNKRDQTLLSELRVALTESSKPVMRRRIWSRIVNNLHVMFRFTEKQLFELAIVYTNGYIEDLKSVTGVELRVDPKLLIGMVKYEEDAQAGARSIINQLETNIFRSFQEQLAEPGVEQIALIQVNGGIEVYTNLDEDFENGWGLVKNLSPEEIPSFVEEFGANLKD